MLEELLVENLRDLLHAEGQLVKALPKMAEAANAETLKAAFDTHLDETVQQVERLKEVFGLLGVGAKAKPCKGMAGLIEEGQEVIEEGEETGRRRGGSGADCRGTEGRTLRDFRLRHGPDVGRSGRSAGGRRHF